MSIKPIPMMLGLLLIAAVPSKAAEKADPAMQKMREAVKNSMIQLRDANAKLATAQAAQAEAEDKVKELQGKLEELTKKSAAERKTANETIDDLRTKLANSEMMGNHLTESLTKWKQGYAKLADYAKATEESVPNSRLSAFYWSGALQTSRCAMRRCTASPTRCSTATPSSVWERPLRPESLSSE